MRRFSRFYLRWKARARARAHRGTVRTIPAVVSPELGNRRNLLVYTPASYARGNARYPVIYMHDGQNLFDAATSFAGDWGLKPALAWASRRGLEAIVVGIPNMGPARIDEYTPFVDPKVGGGDGDRYLDYLINTVKPLVDARFRTLSDRAHTGIAGSSRIGRDVMLGGQAGVADHITVGDGAMLSAQAGVAQDVAPGAKLAGTWGRPLFQARRIWVAQGELPDMIARMKKLERRVAELEARLRDGGRG